MMCCTITTVTRAVGKFLSRNQYALKRPSQKLQNCQMLKFSISSGDMFTREKAVDFLQNSWKVSDVEVELQDDRESFLNKLILAIHERVPFHFLSLHKIHRFFPNGQTIPDFNEIDKACIAGEGGPCSIVNTFTWRLLVALGYSAHRWESTVTHPNSQSAHLILIVKDLVNSGDIHCVDCGLGFPTFEAISLNFDRESPVFNHSYLEYKLIKHNGKILRMHGEGDVVKRNDTPVEGLDFMQGHWRRHYEFTYEDFEKKSYSYDRVIGVDFAELYFTPRASVFTNGKAVMIVGYNLFIEQEDKTLEKTELESNKEMLQAYKDYFPSIDEHIVQDAYSRWQKFFS